jgi:hypothetical protein
MHRYFFVLIGSLLLSTPASGDTWLEYNRELIRIVNDGHTICRLWVIEPGMVIGFASRDAHRETATYELVAERVGTMYITTDPDLVVLRGTCGFPLGFTIRSVPPPWPTPPQP